MSVAYSGKVLKYISTNIIVNDYVHDVQTQLYKRGFLYSQDISVRYDLNTEKAVRNFQVATGLLVDGIVGRSCWDALFGSDEVYSDSNRHYNDIQEDPVETVYVVDKDAKVIPEHNYADALGYDKPFFNSSNLEDLRKSDIEINVNFGVNSPLNETIKHLFLRSSTVEMDGSGMPLFKVYEFIAQDVTSKDK